MLVFQIVIYPPLNKIIGIQRLERVVSFVMMTFFIVTHLLSLLHDKGWVLVTANLMILCAINISANTVGENIAPPNHNRTQSVFFTCNIKDYLAHSTLSMIRTMVIAIIVTSKREDRNSKRIKPLPSHNEPLFLL